MWERELPSSTELLMSYVHAIADPCALVSLPQPSPLPALNTQSTPSFSQSLRAHLFLTTLQLELGTSTCYHDDQVLGVSWKVTDLSVVRGEVPIKRAIPSFWEAWDHFLEELISWHWQQLISNILAGTKTGHLNCRWLKLGEMALGCHPFSKEQQVVPFPISTLCWVACVGLLILRSKGATQHAQVNQQAWLIKREVC